VSGGRLPAFQRRRPGDGVGPSGPDPGRAVDFSRVNVHYLLQARELARRDPARAAVLLGTAERHAALLAELPPEVIAHLALVKVPLMVPRPAGWWWTRLLKALADGRPGELECVLDHLGLTAIR
jgi:hypothetical protein